MNEYLTAQGGEVHGVGVIQSNPDQSKHLETATMKAGERAQTNPVVISAHAHFLAEARAGKLGAERSPDGPALSLSPSAGARRVA